MISPIRPDGDGVTVVLHIQPRASRTELAGRHGDAIKLRVAAPPVDGAANEEVVRFLAARLGLPRRQVTLVAGATGRRKVVRLDGIGPDAAASGLLPPDGGDGRPR